MLCCFKLEKCLRACKWGRFGLFIVRVFYAVVSSKKTVVFRGMKNCRGQRDPCVIVPNSPEYAREGDDLSGAQRLAVMVVDFSRWSRRSFEGLAPPCGRQRESRASLPLQGSCNTHDRRRIEAALLRIALPGGGRKRSRGQ